jgi:hypothetical protein
MQHKFVMNNVLKLAYTRMLTTAHITEIGANKFMRAGHTRKPINPNARTAKVKQCNHCGFAEGMGVGVNTLRIWDGFLTI